MMFVIGAFFWILALAAVSRLLYACRDVVRAQPWIWSLMVLVAIGLLFRPHEDIFGGEDPGSYLNSGVTYGRHGALFYVDPLLVQVPPDDRSAFYYGHAGYGTTKDACLWVVNHGTALLGPHFQPAYPLLISVITQIGNQTSSLYVVPLFALFMGMVLMALASRLLAHRMAGLIAFSFYLLNPLTLWHARCARPEIIAGFMAFAGLALLLLAWQARGWRQSVDILLGALCISAAPFFHITAWYLAVPAAIAIGLIIFSGRVFFLLYPLAALGMLLLFYGQTRYVTDYYHFHRFFAAMSIYRPFLVPGLAVLVVASLTSRYIQKYRSTHRIADGNANRANNTRTVSGWLAAGLALASTLFLINTYLNHAKIGALPILGNLVPNYNILTDWQTFAHMVSVPMAWLVLAGWITWLTGESFQRAKRIGLALTVLPALVLAGTMRDFMMTRYLMLAIVPMSALCLTALVTSLPQRAIRPGRIWLAPSLAALICLLGLAQRSHLATLVEHRGFLRFLSPFANIIQQERGILLGEYSRITAPLEHMFGIRALGLDNERKQDYSIAERAWEQIMRAQPDQPAFFMTPFQPPSSDRFDFRLVKQAVFNDKKLQQAYKSLPTHIKTRPLLLSLYKMALKDNSLPENALTNTATLPLESGNMGLRRFANGRIGKPVLQGISLATDEQVNLSLPSNLQTKCLTLLFVIYSSAPHPMTPMLNGANRLPPAEFKYQFQPLGDHWWAYICQPTTASTDMLTLTARSPCFIANASLQTNTNLVSIIEGFSKKTQSKATPPLQSRWARANAAVLLPAVANGYIFLMISTPDGTAQSFTLQEKTMPWHTSGHLSPGAWQWLVVPLPAGLTHATWLQIQTHPAWNPGKSGFPSDLGVLFGKIAVVPTP